MDEEDKHYPSEYYYPEDLETFDTETVTGFTESQEAIKRFYQPTEKCKHKQEDGYWYKHSFPLHGSLWYTAQYTAILKLQEIFI